MTVVLLSLLVAFAAQWLRAPDPLLTGAQWLLEARLVDSNAAAPPPELATAPVVRLPLRRGPEESSAVWLAIDLPPVTGDIERLVLAYRSRLSVFIDGVPLVRAGEGLDSAQERLVLGHRRLVLDLVPPLHRKPTQTLQLRLGAPGPSGLSIDAPLLGPPLAVQAFDSGRLWWQALRTTTAIGALLVAAFLVQVARVRRAEPVYLLSAVHLALLGLLLAPYVLNEQPVPSPWWRMLLDAADLAAKLLLVAITAHLAQSWTPRLKRGLWVVGVIGLPLDAWAAWQGWAWSDFDHPWAWWAVGIRSGLFALAWCLALGSLYRSPSASVVGTALLVGFSAATWAIVSFGVLVFDQSVIDANALAHAGWVLWVALLLQRSFSDSARREALIRQQLSDELDRRRLELQAAFEAQASAERERAASEQRRRLMQDLHDGLGARLLELRLRASAMTPAELGEALDGCLLEMRLAVDAVTNAEGDLGLLLGCWRQRVEPVLKAAGITFDWRVRASPALPCLRDGGALELVRGLQEALSNCIRHSGATRLVVATEHDAAGVTLWLVDDGRGLDAAAAPGHGRRNIAERAQRLGGHVQWTSPAPRYGVAGRVGTALSWSLPTESAGP